MVPDKVDLQGDFIREDLLREWATQFENFLEAGEADGGIMHAAWPSDWMELERNEVLDEAEQIGGETVEAGAWVQAWKYNDDELWSLISDGVVGGHSIGAVDVTWSNPMYPDEVPDDVDRAEDYGDEQPVWELQGGLVREVSSVDYPAVPDAQILATKGAAAKRLGDHLGNRDDFIAEAMERGHTEDEAERMWDVLHRAIDVEGAGDPGKQSAFTRLGKAVRDVLRLRDDASTAGRPDAKSAGRDDVDEGEQGDKDAAGGDTPADDDGGSKSADDSDMGDTNDNEPPEWAKELQEQVEEQNKRIDEAIESDGDGKNAGDDPFADAPEWAQELKEDVDKQGERIDEISKQTGTTESQQLGGTEKGASGGDDKNSGFTLDPRKAGGN
ncbi:hypothetical protein DJ78_02035 [Halorubrum ezzemoulense]|uniref:Phage-like element PBSX protein XkdF domain-containing protein n=2 Tax=Halorubrum ezzemoulense TaxID=337243 RepID=A0A256JVV7_HALEZ|nr:hypothetical protein DJ78_02035 [Halorubrum ezzemoulense]